MNKEKTIALLQSVISGSKKDIRYQFNKLSYIKFVTDKTPGLTIKDFKISESDKERLAFEYFEKKPSTKYEEE